MQQWEYLTVHIHASNPPYTYTIEDDQTRRWLTGANFSSELGRDGWELAGSIERSGWTILLVFKRPLDEAAEETTRRFDAHTELPLPPGAEGA